MESAKLVATWIREEKLETILPNAPKITSGKIVAHSDCVLSLRSSTAPHSKEARLLPGLFRFNAQRGSHDRSGVLLGLPH
jgi:hypothetical protein